MLLYTTGSCVFDSRKFCGEFSFMFY